MSSSQPLRGRLENLWLISHFSEATNAEENKKKKFNLAENLQCFSVRHSKGVAHGNAPSQRSPMHSASASLVAGSFLSLVRHWHRMGH